MQLNACSTESQQWTPTSSPPSSLLSVSVFNFQLSNIQAHSLSRPTKQVNHCSITTCTHPGLTIWLIYVKHILFSFFCLFSTVLVYKADNAFAINTVPSFFYFFVMDLFPYALIMPFFSWTCSRNKGSRDLVSTSISKSDLTEEFCPILGSIIHSAVPCHSSQHIESLLLFSWVLLAAYWTCKLKTRPL